MDGSTYRELRGIVTQAAEALSQQRIALIAGCSVDSVRNWLRRPMGQLFNITVETYLPRLQAWPAWVAGYLIEEQEIARIHSDPAVTLDDLLREFQARLATAAQLYPMRHICLGCESCGTTIRGWATGRVTLNHRSALIRAVGHLRHLKSWPGPHPTADTTVEEAEANQLVS